MARSRFQPWPAVIAVLTLVIWSRQASAQESQRESPKTLHVGQPSSVREEPLGNIPDRDSATPALKGTLLLQLNERIARDSRRASHAVVGAIVGGVVGVAAGALIGSAVDHQGTGTASAIPFFAAVGAGLGIIVGAIAGGLNK
jgi:hypothetical protein